MVDLLIHLGKQKKRLRKPIKAFQLNLNLHTIIIQAYEQEALITHAKRYSNLRFNGQDTERYTIPVLDVVLRLKANQNAPC